MTHEKIKDTYTQPESLIVDTTTTGTHPTGTYTQGTPSVHDSARQWRDGMVWIDQDDHAKQGMARRGDPEHAVAAPDHPHLPSDPADQP